MHSVSKNVHIGKLGDIVNKYNYRCKIKLFVIKKVKNTAWTFVINDPNIEEIVDTFYEKQLHKTNPQESRTEKVTKKKDNKTDWIIKEIEYDELVKKVNNTNTSDTSDLVKKTDYNTKIKKIEKKISDHDHEWYKTIQKFNKLTSKNVVARLAQANLENKNYIADFIKRTNFDDKLKNHNKKITSNKTRQKSTKGLTADLINKYIIFNGAKYFSLNGLQNYLVFQQYISNFTIGNNWFVEVKSSFFMFLLVTRVLSSSWLFSEGTLKNKKSHKK